MDRALRLAHFCGLVVFLGSILTFIIVSALTKDASLANLAFGRAIISTGTHLLTVPGMWLLAVTGVWLGWRRYGVGQRFFQIKLLLIVLIVSNAYAFVVPAVTTATHVAADSLAQGRLLPTYQAAYLQESVFGALNVVLTLAAAVVGVWRVGVRPATRV
jgi:hypothetical protein